MIPGIFRRHDGKIPGIMNPRGDEMTSYRLGINTCFAVKRWPQPERWARLVRDELRLDLVQHSLDLVDLDAPAAEADDQAASPPRLPPGSAAAVSSGPLSSAAHGSLANIASRHFS